MPFMKYVCYRVISFFVWYIPSSGFNIHIRLTPSLSLPEKKGDTPMFVSVENTPDIHVTPCFPSLSPQSVFFCDRNVPVPIVDTYLVW